MSQTGCVEHFQNGNTDKFLAIAKLKNGQYCWTVDNCDDVEVLALLEFLALLQKEKVIASFSSVQFEKRVI